MTDPQLLSKIIHDKIFSSSFVCLIFSYLLQALMFWTKLLLNFLISGLNDWSTTKFRVPHCANTLYRKFKTNILRNETALFRSQFLHSYISEWIISFHDRFAYCCSKIGGPIVGYINVEIGNEAAQFHF